MKTGRLVYITIPEKLWENFDSLNSFALDLSIPLPVEIPPETKDFNPESLKPEMIFSGILLHLTEDPEGKHSAYYRNLVTVLKPSLSAELQEAAIIKARNGDYETAIEIFDVLSALKGASPALLLNRALVLDERAAAEHGAREHSSGTRGALDSPEHSSPEKAFEEAESAYEKALASPLPDTLFYAALFYEKRGNYSKAASCLEGFLETSYETEISERDPPDDGEDNYTKARELLAEIRNNGLDDNAFAEAVSLIRKGNEEEGIRKAREFLERCPGAGRGWFVLGWGLRRLGRWKDGAACFEKALELGCVNTDTRNELAICLMESGDLALAENELAKALRLDPDNVKIVSNMGILAVKRGERDKAKAFFRIVLDLAPDDAIARSFLGLAG